jgi:hypothetical protein
MWLAITDLGRQALTKAHRSCNCVGTGQARDFYRGVPLGWQSGCGSPRHLSPKISRIVNCFTLDFCKAA